MILIFWIFGHIFAIDMYSSKQNDTLCERNFTEQRGMIQSTLHLGRKVEETFILKTFNPKKILKSLSWKSTDPQRPKQFFYLAIFSLLKFCQNQLFVVDSDAIYKLSEKRLKLFWVKIFAKILNYLRVNIMVFKDKVTTILALFIEKSSFHELFFRNMFCGMISNLCKNTIVITINLMKLNFKPGMNVLRKCELEKRVKL